MTVRYSIVIAIYNDGYLAEALCSEINHVMLTYLGVASLRDEVELLFVDDGSRDDSLALLAKQRERWDFVRVIGLSRNFGQHQAIACGLREARGDVVLRMNVDMQDPPSEIPKLLDVLARDDADLVVGQYAKRHHGAFVRFTAWLYYFLFHFLTGFDSPQNTAPLRAMSRRFVDAYNLLTENSRFPQGLDQWLGFRQRYVRTEHRDRVDARSSYTFLSRSALALTGILYFSDRPLKLVTSLGVVSAVAGLAVATVFGVERLAGYDLLPGWFSLAAIAFVAFGVQVACVGMVGLYVGRIFSEVQGRPLYVISERLDVTPLRAEEP